MPYAICERIKPGGKRCGSPALKGERFCYYHHKLQVAMPASTLFYERLPDAGPGEIPYVLHDLPPLEDAASIQIGYMQVIHGVTNCGLELKAARVILSALHGAAKNLRLLDAAILRAEDLPDPAEEPAPAKKPPASEKQATAERKVKGA